MNTADNIFRENLLIDRKKREALNKHKSFVVWFTGLSGAGKSTLSKILESRMYDLNIRTMVIDGDNTRLGLNKDLKFSVNDRKENIRRVAEVCKMFIEAGVIILASFISPIKSDREMAKYIIGEEDFIEIFVNAPLNVCIERDTKGLYRKALDGLIPDFTGIGSPYEPPDNPAIILDTAKEEIEESISKVWEYLIHKGYISEKF